MLQLLESGEGGKLPNYHYFRIHSNPNWEYLFCWLDMMIYQPFYAICFQILFTNPSAQAGYDTRSLFKRSLTSLHSEFSFSLTSCLTNAEEPSLPYYLPIAGGRIIGFIPFPRILVLCEMQSFSSRIWTRVAVSISYDNNHYITGTSWKRSISWLIAISCLYIIHNF